MSVPIKILLIDDHDLIRGGLKGAFDRDGAFTVVGEAGTLEEGVRQAARLEPDVVVIDVSLPDGSGLDGVIRLRAAQPDLGLVVLTMYNDDEHLFKALDAGASAFVAKSAPAEEVLSAAKHAATSPHAFTAADLGGAMRRRLTPTGPRLTPREHDILTLLAQGLTVPQVAKRLYISESTAKSHLSKTYEKLGASNRTSAVMTALRLGLIDQPNAAATG